MAARPKINHCNPSKPRVLSVFSGGGGLDIGLEAAGFDHLGLIEKCDICLETLSLNRPQWESLPWQDVHDAVGQCTPEYFGIKQGGLELLAGAPPCQPFSKASQWSKQGRKGLADERASTLGAFLELVRSFLPKVVLLENVPEFWSDSAGAKALIIKFFDELNSDGSCNYKVEAKILDAADYGVPQIRRRLILIAVRDGVPHWPKPTYSGKPMTAWDALANIIPEEKPEAKGKWADLLPSIPEGENYIWHSSRGGGSELFGYRTRFWSFLLKLSKSKPAWTLAAQPGPSTGPFHWESRPLAKEEMLALQTFPINWQLSGCYREQIKQIGNATPSLLGEVLGRSLMVHIFNLPVPKKKRFSLKRAGEIPVSEKIEKMCAGYTHLVKNYPEHPGKGKGPRPIMQLNT